MAKLYEQVGQLAESGMRIKDIAAKLGRSHQNTSQALMHYRRNKLDQARAPELIGLPPRELHALTACGFTTKEKVKEGIAEGLIPFAVPNLGIQGMEYIQMWLVE